MFAGDVAFRVFSCDVVFFLDGSFADMCTCRIKGVSNEKLKMALPLACTGGLGGANS